MISRASPITAERFLGVNRRDGADLVQNNEFYTLQNWYPAVKGQLYKIEGTTDDLTATDVPLASKITGITRSYDPFGRPHTLYYCEPDGSTFPTPSANLTVTEGASGTGKIYNGGSVTLLTIKYTWVGCGTESDFHTQTYTPSANNKAITLTAPSFPPGVRSANVYAQTASNDIYMLIGAITQSGGSLVWDSWIHPGEDLSTPTVNLVTVTSGGNLKKGTYYISGMWLSSYSGPPFFLRFKILSNTAIPVQVLNDGSKIEINITGTGSGGAKAALLFIGTGPQTEVPHLWAGTKMQAASVTTGLPENLVITDMPKNINIQTHAYISTSGSQALYTGFLEPFEAPFGQRNAFLIKKDENGVLSEVLVSRSLSPADSFYKTPVYGVADSSLYDTVFSRITPCLLSGSTRVHFTRFLGRTYFANNRNFLMLSDGFAAGRLQEKINTYMPGIPSYVSLFKDQLVMLVNDFPSQVFGSNSYAPENWADGGTGAALRYITVGDSIGDSIKCAGIYSYTSGIDGPRSLLTLLKKTSVWTYTNIPDATSGVRASADQVSGRVGCIAQRTVVPTPAGLAFLGSDGIVYLFRGAGDPIPIGEKIRPSTRHLAENDTLMAMCSASFHKGFYKLSIPSTSTSTYADVQWWADLRTQDGSPISWSGPHTGVSLFDQTSFVGELDGDTRYGARGDAFGAVRLDDPSTFQHRGVDVPSVIQWKTTRAGMLLSDKRVLGLVLDAYFDSSFSHEVLAEMFADSLYGQVDKVLSSGTGTWDSSSYDSGLWGDAMYFNVPMMLDQNLVGRALSWKLTHSNNAQFILSAVSALVIPERRIKV